MSKIEVSRVSLSRQPKSERSNQNLIKSRERKKLRLRRSPRRDTTIDARLNKYLCFLFWVGCLKNISAHLVSLSRLKPTTPYIVDLAEHKPGEALLFRRIGENHSRRSNFFRVFFVLSLLTHFTRDYNQMKLTYMLAHTRKCIFFLPWSSVDIQTTPEILVNIGRTDTPVDDCDCSF